MDKYKNKYRIASARAQWWGYGWNGAYFITICTQNREHFFGKINNGVMVLSRMGVIADILWHEIPNHSKYVELGDFVVMPNHIHGILILDKPNGCIADAIVDSTDDSTIDSIIDINVNPTLEPSVDPPVQTLHATSLPAPGSQSPYNERMAKISPKSGSISTILRSYKSAVTKHANRLRLENGWQTRFHDHIIRNDAQYQRISNYIINNPGNWKEDKFY